MAAAKGVRVLLCTAPPGKASEIAHSLVEARLAACVNLVPGLRSVYRWKGAVCDDPETLLIIKTTDDRQTALARRLTELHPYEVPELLSLPPGAGLTSYLSWVAAAVSNKEETTE